MLGVAKSSSEITGKCPGKASKAKVKASDHREMTGVAKLTSEIAGKWRG